ncbi:hypothetical protein ABZ612_35175 [Streptomyces avermitilis]|uniref:hypothetical protein n=1 Tax=Streptomyces avermitilis TaxID=33903 RepID=UPI0033ECF4D2
MISKNVAGPVKVRSARKVKRHPWSPDSDFVFTTRCGTPFEPRNLNRQFTDRSARAGIRRILLHDARHTGGSHLGKQDRK